MFDLFLGACWFLIAHLLYVILDWPNLNARNTLSGCVLETIQRENVELFRRLFSCVVFSENTFLQDSAHLCVCVGGEGSI